MPTFTTPAPIAAVVQAAGAHVRVTASDRPDTVVLVEPLDPTKRLDVKVAARTKVVFADGRLKVKTTVSGAKDGSVAVTIDLPTGSSLIAYTTHSSVQVSGLLGDVELHTAKGRFRLDRIAALQANIAGGEVEIGQVAGCATIDGSVVAVRIGEVTGAVKLSNSGGQTWIGHAMSDVDLSSANGGFDIDRAGGSVTAQTANGAIRIGRLTRGQADLSNSSGKHRGRHQRRHRRPGGRQQHAREGAQLRCGARRCRPVRKPGHDPRPHAARRHRRSTRRELTHGSSEPATSSCQLVRVPSRVASVNRASPRWCRARCSIRATSGWERSGSPRTAVLAASSRAACSYCSRRSARSATPTSTCAIR